MPRSAHPRRSGFTLIELLAVVSILLLLAGMVFVAVQKGRIAAQRRAVLTEMKAMENALNRYKELHQSYPPCMGDLTLTTSGTTNPNGVQRYGRQNRFTYHMRVGWQEARNNGIYSSYIYMRNFIYTNYQVRLANGSLIYLDLNNMDQAEALVFWLGGFPTPVGSSTTGTPQPLGNRKLFGFYRQMINPFQVDFPTAALPDLPMQTRWWPEQQYGFEFNEDRLRDSDQDGWYEYVPPVGNYDDANETLAPYVYFDCDLYAIGQWGLSVPPPYLAYPTPGSGWSTSTQLVSSLVDQWGSAVPFATYVDTNTPTSPIQWQNPTSFQIISAGLDGVYCDPATANATLTQPRIPTYPSGNVISTTKGNNATMLDDSERDNLTNFSNSTLGDDAAAGS
ncbi:MAG: type II secretion system protein [Planctomycetes bacterium]|nr:type II secretion system protein [Planctomycetota bacterium]